MSSESVVIHNFWARSHGRPIVFHARGDDPATSCEKEAPWDRPACGHALPRDLAEQIAQPCGRCYPSEGTA